MIGPPAGQESVAWGVRREPSHDERGLGDADASGERPFGADSNRGGTMESLVTEQLEALPIQCWRDAATVEAQVGGLVLASSATMGQFHLELTRKSGKPFRACEVHRGSTGLAMSFSANPADKVPAEQVLRLAGGWDVVAACESGRVRIEVVRSLLGGRIVLIESPEDIFAAMEAVDGEVFGIVVGDEDHAPTVESIAQPDLIRVIPRT
jgi:hypothetical protein